MAIYMKYGNINGPVTTTGYDKYIELHSFQWGVGRGVTMAHGTKQGRESSLPSLSEVTVSKLMDASSADLLKTALKGDAQEVTLKFTRTDTSGSGGNDYLSIKMKDVILSGYSVSSGGDMPSESLSLNYAEIEFTETPMDDTGKAGTPVKVGFNLATMKLS